MHAHSAIEQPGGELFSDALHLACCGVGLGAMRELVALDMICSPQNVDAMRNLVLDAAVADPAKAAERQLVGLRFLTQWQVGPSQGT